MKLAIGSLVLGLALVSSGTARGEATDQPVLKLGKDGKPDKYFMDHHRAFIKRGQAGPIGVLFLGDSITDFWPNAASVWDQHYGKYHPANFGVSGDRTEHVLWRITNGELDGIHPKVVVLLIGTNNCDDTVEHILAGDRAVVNEIYKKLPRTKVLLLGIFPRGADGNDGGVKALRAKLAEVNDGLAKLDDGKRTRYLDIGPKFLDDQGNISPEVLKDGLHPATKGYEIWADAMQPLLDQMMK